MEDNYSLEKLIAACEEKKKEETKIPDIRDIRKETMMMNCWRNEKEKDIILWIPENMTGYQDEEMGSSIIGETDNLWMPVKRFPE